MVKGLFVGAAVVLLLAAGCSDPVSNEPAGVAGVSADGFAVAVWAEGFNGPTQLFDVDGQRFLLADLGGGEEQNQGRVLLLEVAEGEVRTSVLYKSLDKPTGVAVIDDEVYVMERNRLSKGDLDGGDLSVIVDDMPFNGRSQGSLSVIDGKLFYNTSGDIDDGEVVEGSGALWMLVADEPVQYGSGFKHAYSHTINGDGNLVVADLSDGSFDGEPSADALFFAPPDVDGGWPRCVADVDRDVRPVEEFDGGEDDCFQAIATFEPGATPTSVAHWQDALFVALWNRGEVVRVDEASGATVVAVFGIDHPQHLLVSNDQLFVVDHGGNRILVFSVPK